MDTIKTEIVEATEYRSKLFVFGFSILYIASATYIFLLEDTYPNEYLKFASFIIYLYGLYFLFRQLLLKPKTIGSLIVTSESLKFEYNDIQDQLDFSTIQQLKLLYTGYASWSQYIWGNKNYLEIKSTNGNKYQFEFLIKDKRQKNKLKKIFKSQSIKDQFELVHQKNSGHRF